MNIYLDMDGVLVDFDKGLEQFNIVNDTTFIHRPKAEWTPLQIKLDREVVDCMNTPGFFENLPLMEGAGDLWKAAGRPSVLTAYPSTGKDILRVAREKRNSIEFHFGEVSDDRFICCARSEKAYYATKQSYPFASANILVDDLEANCEAWEAAGGIAILFKTSKQAIKELNNMRKLVG